MTNTIAAALEAARGVTSRGYTFLDANLAEHAYSFDALAKAAEKRGRQLLGLGLKKGDRVALVVPDNEDFVLTFLGAVAVGVVPVPMYPPLALGKLDSYLESAGRILRGAGARVLVTTGQVAPILWGLVGKVDGLEDLVLVDRLEKTAPWVGAVEPIRPEDTCFLQFTSGSTSEPKGVVVTHGNLIANTNAIMRDGLATDSERDRGVSWLPLYHDMGLIGFVLAPLVHSIDIVFIQTLSFVKRPNVWLDVVSRYRATITFAPNFAFALSAKRANRQVGTPGFDLSSLRVVGCGAEPINADTIRGFVEAYSPAGLNPNAIMPCYGMAEATLAMSFEPLDEPFVSATIEREAYENEKRARRAGEGLELVACGRTFPGHGLRVMNERGELLEDGQVGELVFRGPSVTPGYFRNDSATKETIVDGWLHTGDLGFILDGRIYVSGRQKDLIILNGRNYYPQAIEWEVEQVPDVRKGNVVCFATRGSTTEHLVVVAESKTKEPAALAERIRAAVSESMGLKVDDVVIVPAGALPKTSSGKLQRRKTKQQYEEKTLGIEGVRTMGKNATRATIARHVTKGLFARVRHNVKRAIPAVVTNTVRRRLSP